MADRLPHLTRTQWIWLVRGLFTVFAAIVAFALYEAVRHEQWLSVGLLSGLLISVPCMAGVVEYGSDL